MTPDEAWIHEQWRIAESIVGNKPGPRYDDPRIVTLEEQGRISVPDDVLARVLSTTPERDAMKYWPVLSWSELETRSLHLRFLPSALGLPNVGDDLHRALPLIDSQTPHRFFTRTVRRSLRST